MAKQKFYTDDKGGGGVEMILANSANNLISANENIIFPGELPKIIKNKYYESNYLFNVHRYFCKFKCSRSVY